MSCIFRSHCFPDQNGWKQKPFQYTISHDCYKTRFEEFWFLPKNAIVFHAGTSSIVHETTYQPLLSTLAALVETVVELKRNGHRVVLVSSGAIGVGLKRMNLARKPDSLAGKQVLFLFPKCWQDYIVSLRLSLRSDREG